LEDVKIEALRVCQRYASRFGLISLTFLTLGTIKTWFHQESIVMMKHSSNERPIKSGVTQHIEMLFAVLSSFSFLQIHLLGIKRQCCALVF
jgi:hypothetical protein